MRIQSTLLIVGLFSPIAVAATTKDVWTTFVEQAEAEFGASGKRAAMFLAEHRPPRDADIALDILMDNLRYALRAREEFPWTRALSEARFFNDVLPYATVDEPRESWRPDFYNRGRAIVAGSRSATEAAQRLNAQFFKEINVHYNTGRKRTNQSPSESIAQGKATCTGLSILLVDVCRAVGIPARMAGIARWPQKPGNHTWVEIWDNGWHFTGADEYNAAGLNRAWFVNDAKGAVAGSSLHGIWATSWERTGTHYPMAWSPSDTTVPGVDVTSRYAGGSDEAAARRWLDLRVWTRRGGERIVATTRVIGQDRKTIIAEVTSRAGTNDLNDMPRIRVAPGIVPHRVEVVHNGHTRVVGVQERDLLAQEPFDLYWDELGAWQPEGLSRAAAQAALRASAIARADVIRDVLKAELAAQAIRAGDHTLRLKTRQFGEAPDRGASLWISLHGGGGAPTEVNDRQWANQARLYQPTEGIYVAPRAPTDTWNLWHQSHIDELLSRLIEAYVVTGQVDPNRVYLMGYSAGGDGVFQVAPRMADRFAAAAMMAGHPNETKPLGLRNLPFALFMGADDAAYNRNGVARDWRDQLAALRASDPEGYPHWVQIYDGLGHWMDGRDREAMPWMAKQQRNLWPKRVVWLQDDVIHGRFYWLGVETDTARARSLLQASVDGQTISLASESVKRATLYLNDALVDLDQPIRVVANDRVVFHGYASRSQAAIERSLTERFDPPAVATALLEVTW